MRQNNNLPVLTEETYMGFLLLWPEAHCSLALWLHMCMRVCARVPYISPVYTLSIVNNKM